MPKAPTYNGSTNPNAKGGAFGYDGRTGLGIGSLTKHPASGLGSNWSMGDALSSPVGEWDKEIAQDELEVESYKSHREDPSRIAKSHLNEANILLSKFEPTAAPIL